MSRKPVNLSLHINETIERGHSADFPVSLRPLSYLGPDQSAHTLPNRLAVVRDDTGEALSVVSDRYTFVPHQQLLGALEQAISSLDVGPVPRGVYVDRNGARMRAIFKFPALCQVIAGSDEICPCVQVANTYDATSRIQVSIGAFRFVCTNLAVGGGGVFAGGFVSVHTGEIEIDRVAGQLSDYLAGFEVIVAVYRQWMDMPVRRGQFQEILEPLGKPHGLKLLERLQSVTTVYAAYNVATDFATHSTRSFRIAFQLLERINRGFQRLFPASPV